MNTKENFVRRMIVMLLGLVVLSLGIAFFKVAAWGNDPSTALMMAIGGRIGIDFSIVLLIANTLMFVFEVIWGRKLIGVGTFFNWFGVGTMASMFIRLLYHFFPQNPDTATRFIVLIVGVLVLSFGAAMYQTADLGIAPYDALSLMIDARVKYEYFWCRIFTDATCSLIAFLLGGIVGLGTLICALGLGPFITFFNKLCVRKMCGVE